MKKVLGVSPVLLLALVALGSSLGVIAYRDSLVEKPRLTQIEEKGFAKQAIEFVTGERLDREHGLITPEEQWDDGWGRMAKADQRRQDEEDRLNLDERYETVYLFDNSRYLLYSEKNFDLVEEQLQNNFSDASDPLKAHRYHRLLSTMGSFYYPERPEELITILDEWVEAKPESHLALTVRGKYHISYAWYYRGTGWASEVPEKSMKKFKKHLNLALFDLEQAYELNPDDPEASVALITVAGGGTPGARSIRHYYDRAIAANPLHYGARSHALNYLQPKWGGAWGNSEAIVFETEEYFYEYPVLELVVYDSANNAHASGEISDEEWTYIRTDPRWMNIYERLLEKHPGDVHLLDSAAYFANIANELQKAADYYEEIGDRYPAGGRAGSLFKYHGWRARSLLRLALVPETIDTEEGFALVKRALDMDPENHQVYYAYGKMLVSRNRLEEARVHFATVTSKYDDDASSYLDLANILLKEGEYEDAIHWAEQGLSVTKSDTMEETLATVIEKSKANL